MKKVFLLGHTGSLNRGCEAIVRSTVKLLKNAGVEKIYVAGLEETYARKLELNLFQKIMIKLEIIIRNILFR